ncbi:hypothetical protein ABPG75_005578 [Micractinium tetrahymenae]
MAAAGHRSVQFDAQPTGAYAVHLRLTPALLEALLRAQETGQTASIRFGAGAEGGAVSVADTSFPFRALEEHSSCDLLRLPLSGAGGQLLGAVRQKLVVQRIVEEERSRVRARGEEAERRGHERTAKLLSGAKAPQAGKPGRPPAATTMQRRVTPPPGAGRGPTPPPQLLTASMLSAPAGRPPAHPAGPAQAPPPAPAPAPALAKPMHKSASTGKLGLTSKGGSGSALPQKASPRVLQAARAGVGLRLLLIAVLAERPMGKDAVRAVVKDAASRVKSFKAPRPDEFDRTLKAVAEYRSPGFYVVYPMLLKELDSLPAAPEPGKEGKRRSSTPPEQRGPSPKAKKAAAAGGGGGGAAGGAGRKAAGAKRKAAEWTDDDSDAEGQPPAAQRPRSQPPAAAPALVHAKAASEPALLLSAARGGASPPSVGGGPAGGSSSSGGLAAGAAGASAGGGRLTRRTSSSRGSEHADESWIEEHADRQPEPAALITSKEEYRARETAFAARYALYFELHQLIEAHKKDFEALDAAMRGASTEAERERHRAELERLHHKHGQRAKRWDAAYRVLHQELSAAKARMAEFVQRLQQQQQQPQASGQRPGRSGTPPDALPTVRVQ